MTGVLPLWVCLRCGHITKYMTGVEDVPNYKSCNNCGWVRPEKKEKTLI